MGEIEGSYRVLQTPGTRLGAQFNAGISTLEPGQSLSGNMVNRRISQGRGIQIRVQGLDDSQEFFDIEVGSTVCGSCILVCLLKICLRIAPQKAPSYLGGLGRPGLCVSVCLGDSCHMALVLKSLPL